MRIGIYGGSFSPIHNGHIRALKAFLDQMQLDFVYVIPTYIPPHKQTSGVIDSRHRLKMCELALEGIDGVVVSDIEIARGGTSYTVDTLRSLYREENRLFLLMGTDMMLTLDTWREPEEIFRLCYPVYMRRENDKANDALIVKKISEYLSKYGKVVRRIMADPIEISSTEIRRRLSKGDDVSAYLPEKVIDYIKENQLFTDSEN
ncbi:MAG: nicotinate (nicotinamide) nucleotide adenylyltransferase [Ruminococcaceae bacterium]|nr:nicotinate (nicotinamide) nucleotide adenylyltransferase [Oscillospiraceae bacterium]